MRCLHAVAAAALLLACLTPEPSSLEARLQTLALREAACADAACRDAARAELLALAERAAAAAERPGGPGARMRQLSVAGLAGWRAGPAGRPLATRVAELALGRCRVLDELAHEGHASGAADACVALEALPALLAHAEYRELLQALEAAPADDAGAAQLAAVASQYPGETFGLLEEIGGRLRAYAGVSPATLGWLEATATLLFCDFRLAGELGLRHWPERESLHAALGRELAYGASLLGRDVEGCAPGNPLSLPPAPPS